MSDEPRATSEPGPAPAVPRLVQLAIRNRHQEAALEWYVRSVLPERGPRSSVPPPSPRPGEGEPPEPLR